MSEYVWNQVPQCARCGRVLYVTKWHPTSIEAISCQSCGDGEKKLVFNLPKALAGERVE